MRCRSSPVGGSVRCGPPRQVEWSATRGHLRHQGRTAIHRLDGPPSLPWQSGARRQDGGNDCAIASCGMDLAAFPEHDPGRPRAARPLIVVEPGARPVSPTPPSPGLPCASPRAWRPATCSTQAARRASLGGHGEARRHSSRRTAHRRWCRPRSIWLRSGGQAGKVGELAEDRALALRLELRRYSPVPHLAVPWVRHGH